MRRMNILGHEWSVWIKFLLENNWVKKQERRNVIVFAGRAGPKNV